jgi:hypothetical protein
VQCLTITLYCWIDLHQDGPIGHLGPLIAPWSGAPVGGSLSHCVINKRMEADGLNDVVR